MPALGRHDAGSNGVVKAERRTDGQHPLSDAQGIRVAQLHGGQVVRIDLQQGHVGTAVGADQACLVFALVVELDGDFIASRHHMGVGQDVTVRRNDETRPERHGFFTLLLRRGKTAEKLKERVTRRQVRQGIGCRGAGILSGGNVDDRPAFFVHQLGKIGQPWRLRCSQRGRAGRQGKAQGKRAGNEGLF